MDADGVIVCQEAGPFGSQQFLSPILTDESAGRRSLATDLMAFLALTPRGHLLFTIAGDLLGLPPALARRLAVNEANSATFRPKLSGVYAAWKKNLGSKCWSLLESASGRLA